ncbi:MAG: hypothetical protein KDD64_16300, partial [Bdellovibrionales bacterium]|nr:hypothetical protein [Bdellovibrionales bacterium]
IANGMKIIETDNVLVAGGHHCKCLFTELIGGRSEAFLRKKYFEGDFLFFAINVAGTIDNASRTPSDDGEDLVPIVEDLLLLTCDRHTSVLPQ